MDSMIEADRYCKVCGDKAVYVNYGALTCDSCKTFFRRQNLHPKVSYDHLCFISSSLITTAKIVERIQVFLIDTA